MFESIASINDISGEKKRVVITMSDGNAVFLFKATVKEYALKEGQLITTEEVKRIAKEGEEHLAFTTAMDSLSRGIKSKNEIVKMLKTKKFSAPVIEATVNKLLYYKYLGDEDYVRTYIDYKGEKMGRRKIIYDLVTVKGLPKSVVESVAYELLPDEKQIEIATAMAEKYLDKEKKKRTRLRDRTYGFLASRGFDIDIIISVIDKLDFKTEDDDF